MIFEKCYNLFLHEVKKVCLQIREAKNILNLTVKICLLLKVDRSVLLSISFVKYEVFVYFTYNIYIGHIFHLQQKKRYVFNQRIE